MKILRDGRTPLPAVTLSTGIASIGFRPPRGKIHSQGRPLNTPSHGGNLTEWRNYFEYQLQKSTAENPTDGRRKDQAGA